MKAQEILYRTNGYTVIFRQPQTASDAGNNIDVRQESTGLCWNIRELAKDALGRCGEDLYTAVRVEDGLLHATTFRGLQLSIDLKQRCVIEKRTSK